MPFKKGAAVASFSYRMLDINGDPVTSGTTTGLMTINGVQGATVANSTYVANGIWNTSFTAAEMNGDDLHFLPVNTSTVTSGIKLMTYEQLDANVISINSDTTAGINLKNQYDGATGLTGETFPTNQGQFNNISTGTGGFSINVTGFILNTGVVDSGTYEDTFTDNGVYHVISDDGGVIDVEYTIDVGTNGTAQLIEMIGYVNGGNDDIQMKLWNWVTSQRDDLLLVNGKNNQNNETYGKKSNVIYTGTGSNSGKARLFFEGTGLTNATLAIDQLSATYGVVIQESGLLHSGQAQAGGTNTITLDAGASAIDNFYVNAKIITTYGTGVEQENIITSYNGTNKIATVKSAWHTVPDATTGFDVVSGQVHAATTAGGYDGGKVYINGDNGSAGTQTGVNGTIINPSDNLSDARAIADNQNIKTFRFGGGAVFTFDQNYLDFIFEMTTAQFMDLGGNDMSGSVFQRSGITGTMTASERVVFERCGLVSCTLGVCNLLDSGMGGTITLSSQDFYLFDKCFEFAGVPTLNISGDNTTPTAVTMSGYEGRLVISGMTSVDILFLSGFIHVTFDSSCSGGTVYRSGDIKTTDNSLISPTFVGGVINEIDVTTLGTSTKVDSLPTNLELNARTLLSAEYGTATNQTTINDNVLTRLPTASYVAPDNASITSILADTNELQSNQGNWLTATGFSTFNPATDTVANVTTVQTTVTNTDMKGTDNALLASSYTAPDNTSITAILADTNELQLNQGDWATATGFSTFNAATDGVIVTTNNDKTGYSIAGAVNANISTINNVPIVGNGSTVPFDV